MAAAARIERVVRFVAWESLPERPAFDLEQFSQLLNALEGDDWRLVDEDMTTGAVVQCHGDPLCLRYFRLREEGDLPSRLDAGRQTLPLVLAAGESITDWVHAVI